MSSTYKGEVTRLEINIDTGQVLDKATSAPPNIWRGFDGSFQLGLVRRNLSDMVNVGLFANIRLEIKSLDSITSDPIFYVSISNADLIGNANITKAQWDAGTHQHGEVEYTKVQSNLPTYGASKDYWLVITATTTVGTGSKEVPLGTTLITFTESGKGGTPPDPGSVLTWITREEADTVYMPISDISYLDDAIDTINADITAIEGDITTINTTVGGHTTSIGTINTTLSSQATFNNTVILRDGTRTFTGHVTIDATKNLTLGADPSSAMHAVTKQFGEAQYILRNSATAGHHTMATELLLNSNQQASGTSPTDGTALTVAASQGYVKAWIGALRNGVSANLDTLAELAAAINNDPAFNTTINTAIGNRIHKDGTVQMTGDLLLKAATNPSNDDHAARKKYVDDGLALKASLAGGAIFSGLVSFSGSTNAGIKLANVLNGSVASPATGMTIYDTDRPKMYIGTAWKDLIWNGYPSAWASTGDYTLTNGDLLMSSAKVIKINSQTVVKGRLTTINDLSLPGGPTISDAFASPTNIDSIVDSSGGTPSGAGNFEAVTDFTTTGSADLAPVANNFAVVAAELTLQRALNEVLLNALWSCGQKVNHILDRLKPTAGHGLIA